MPHKTKQLGSAVIVALFVVALTAIASIAMITRLQQDTHRTELLLNATNANYYVQGSVIWAEDQLSNNVKFQQTGQVTDKTPIVSPVNKMNNATIETKIEDAQSLFNLNNLTDESYRPTFSKLIKTVSPKMSNTDIQAIVLATTDWITSNANSTYDTYYATLNPPYRAPHRLMVSPSELRLVKGITSDLFNALSPYVIALPVATSININNAKAPLLMALSPTLTMDGAKAIESACQEAPFASLDMFHNMDIVKNNPFTDSELTTTSTYFLVTSYVTIGNQNIITYTLLERDTKNSQPVLTILWQTKGTL